MPLFGSGSCDLVTVNRLALGMPFSEVRAVAGKMEWMAMTPETMVYRARFAKRPNCGLICPTYPVLLTFDKEAKLTSFWRRYKVRPEDFRPEPDWQISRLDSRHHDCDCGHDRDCRRSCRSYFGQGLDDVYRSISGYGLSLHAHEQD